MDVGQKSEKKYVGAQGFERFKELVGGLTEEDDPHF
jgi:hypothetical protein